MGDDITVQRDLSLAVCIHKTIPAYFHLDM